MKFKNFLLLIIIAILFLNLVNCGFIKYKREVKKISVGSIDLSKIKDGNYRGEYDLKYVKAVVNVKVKDNKIISIDLVEHKNAKGGKAKIIPDRVVKNQTLQVDMVTGATNSSKVILKAIENALIKGLR